MSSRIAIIALTKGGSLLAERLAALLPGSEQIRSRGKVQETLARVWQDYDSLTCIMAAGIVVRCIAPRSFYLLRLSAANFFMDSAAFSTYLYADELNGGSSGATTGRRR